MQAIAIVNDIAQELTDPNFRIWSKENLTDYLNSAQLLISELRPDATSAIENLTLDPGTKQTLQASHRRLLDLVRNMGSDGVTPGKPIWAITEEILNTYRPKWHSESGKTVVRNFVYDERTPSVFYVYPPVHPTIAVIVEGKIQKNPEIITDVDSEAIELNDAYVTAIKQWMLYRAYSKETDSMESRSLASEHYRAFAELMGVKVKVLREYTPSAEIKKGTE
jgi:hypothetical protein